MIPTNISKLLTVFPKQQTQTQKIQNVVCLKRYKSTEDVQPVNMAFTAYETINAENDKDMPILILHGLLGSKSNWNTMGREIALKTFRKVVALDLRNHGDSPHSKEFGYSEILSDLKHAINDLNVPEVTLLGHSIGGRAALAFALRYPELVHDLVAVDISPLKIRNQLRNLPSLLDAMKGIRLSSEHLTLLQARLQADRQLMKSVNSKPLRDFLLMNLAYDEKRKKFFWKVNIQAILEKLHTFDDFPFGGVFDKPTLFVAGSKSDYMRRGDEPLVLKKFPKAKFEYIENSGHLVHVEKPQEFLNILTSFLEEQERMSAVS